MAASRILRNPSPYSPLPFHLLRFGQLISALIVSAVVSYFLLTASVLTILALVVSSALYHFRTLPPKYNLTNNGALSLLWILGLSFLTWNTGWTLGHRCLIENWKTEAGIMVCRLYKACTAFTVTGLVTTLLALLLDLRTQRKTTQLGKYNQMHEPDSKRSIPIISSPVPQYESYISQRADDTGDLGDQKPYRVQESIEVQHFGYSAPTEQTRYDPAHGRY
ncbi:MAG: hypothetical protein L6R41_002196 [Letrouitia leprolyta]|nr:MAG: hypothetical protein L6R41_002196 [Letrouitia leprolyta]